MMEEKSLAVWKPNVRRGCLYDWNGIIIIETAAALSLPFFILARNDASSAWPYTVCIIAAITVMIIATCAKKLPMIIKGLPILLYAAYYIGQAYLTINRVQDLERYTMPALILSELRLLFGIAMAIAVVVLHFKKDSIQACAYWNTIGNACMFSVVSDVIMFVVTFLALDIGVLLGTNLYELTIRIFGEFWFSMAALIAIQPKYLTINYRKVNRLLWDYLSLIPWISLVVAAIMLVVFKESINIRFLMWSVASFDMEILMFKWMIRKLKTGSKLSHKASKNYIRVFCSRRWVYTYSDIEAILSIQKRLDDIKMEQMFLKKIPFTDYTVERLNALDEEECNLLMRLEWRYSIPIRLPMEL